MSVLPASVDYTKVLPLAVESRSRRRTYFPTNGASFNSSGNNIIRIDLSANAFLDPKHSYLRFSFANTAGAGNTMGLDFGGGHGFLRRLRIEQAGNVLSDCQNYNKLMSSIVLPCQGGIDSLAHRSITEGQKFCNDAAAGNSNLAAPAAEVSGATGNTATNSNQLIGVAAGANVVSYTFAIPLLNGLLGTTQDKMVPLQLLGSSPITIEIELAPAIDIGVYAGGADPTGYEIFDVRYVANLVEVGPEVEQQLRMVQDMSGGRLVLNGVDYTHFAGNISAGATGRQTINVPARRKSMKSLFFVGASNTFGAGVQRVSYNLSYGGNFNMREYQLKIGSVMYPPTPVQALLDTPAGTAAGRAEAAAELAKCLGTLGSTHGTGVLSRINTYVTDCDVAGMAGPSPPGGVMVSHQFSPFGIDLEAFQRTAIESGVNTADRSLPISLIVDIGAAGAEAINIDAYVAYDSLYFIDSAGNISVSM